MATVRVWIGVAACCAVVTAAASAQEPDDDKPAGKGRCGGKPANVVGTDKSEVIKLSGGGNVVDSKGGDDVIIGTSKRDIICTARGQDRIKAGGGNDLISGGLEADIIQAGAGDNVVDAGGAKDIVKAGAGNDTLIGARGDDQMSAGAGNDLLLGAIGADRLSAGAGDDTIVAEQDVDRVDGGPGNDSIDGGAGPDLIEGGSGNDSIRGNTGGDTITAGPGNDLVMGGPGGEYILGGPGDDHLYGELVDDRMWGGSGNDLLSGGHGVDDMFGEDGDDWLRGDLNLDFNWGGTGNDTVSYATATPPGPTPTLDGITVNLKGDKALEEPPQVLVSGDDTREHVAEIENVIGSNYDDSMSGEGGQGTATGLGGNELCVEFLSTDCNPTGDGTPNVSMATPGIDPGLLINGGPGEQTDALELSATATTYVVTSNVAITSGAGCFNNAANIVSCAKPQAPLGYATMYGGGGPDTLSITQGLPETAVVVLDGGPGDDIISGSTGAEILRGGISGNDKMYGGAGDDAIFSGPGGDLLEGGAGNDQLVTTSPCDGHIYSGGSGAGDIAGFAQALDYGIEATLGGKAIGRGISPCAGTQIQGDNEILEGTQHGDVLVGNDRDNPLILGKNGNDVIIGMGGADVLRGERGQDAMFGGPGPDVLQAFDAEKDIGLFCGPGGHHVIRDKFDPPGAGCNGKKFNPRAKRKTKPTKKPGKKKPGGGKKR